MKTVHNLTLILHKLCNKKNETRNRSKSKKLLLIPMLVFMGLLPLQKTIAQATSEIYYSLYPVKASQYNTASPFTTVDINFMYYSQIEHFNCVRNMVVSYLSPIDNTTYIKLLDYSYIEGGSGTTYSPSTAPFSSVGTVSSAVTYDATRTYFSAIGALHAGYYIGATVKWDFPPCLVGKTIKLKVEGLWLEAFNQGYWPTGFTMYYDLPAQSLTKTSQFSCSPLPSGKKQISWKNAVGLSKIILYSDANYTKKVDSVDVSPASVKDDSIMSKVISTDKISQSNIYYVKGFYNVSGPSSGTNYVTYGVPLGPITQLGYIYPTLNNINFDACSKSVTMNWTNNAPSQLDTKSKIYIYRKRSDESIYTLLTQSGQASNVTSYEDKDASLVWDKTYTYIIRSCPDAFLTGGVTASSPAFTNSTAPTYIPELLVSASITASRQVLDFSKFTVTSHIAVGNNAANAELKWTKVSTCTNNPQSLTVVRVNILNPLDIYSQQVSASSLKYVDNSVVNNNPYKYCLVADNSGRADSSAWVNVNIVDQCKFLKFTTTKGVLNDRIKLSWEIDKPLLNQKFVISRKIYDNNSKMFDYEAVAEKQSTNSIENWEDLSVSPGILYKYKVESYYQPPTGSLILVSTVDSIGNGLGFSQPIGTISGNVVFGSGTAVDGVSVSVVNTNTDQKLYKSLEFSQSGAAGTVALKATKHGCIATGFTWQAFIKPANRTQVNATIYEMQDEYSVRINGNSINVFVNDKSLTVPVISKNVSAIATNKFFQLTVSYNKTTQYFKLYVDGVCNDSTKLTATYTCKNRKEARLAGSYQTGETYPNYKGLIDEMRLWNRALTSAEINTNYDRYLSGSETDLIGYWQMDEGIGGFAFDKSNISKSYNENHITLNGAACSDSVPSLAQLSIKALTDINGNYIIQGVPYKGNGSTYDVVPLLGTHEFEPARQQIFIGGTSSEVQSKINFKDISSFAIKGNIFYENTNYPVADVQFAVDGNVCTRENKILASLADGSYEIDVPIGEHKISLLKNGHVFTDSDPNATLKMNLKYNFNENKSDINFTDITKVTLVGRVVGGAVQAAEPIGFSKSIANIGQATVKIQPQLNGKYQLNYNTTFSSLMLNGRKNINSVSSIRLKSDTIVIITDSLNGEFAVLVPPIPMKILDVKTGDFVASDFKLGTLINMNPMLTQVDTIHKIIKIGGIAQTVIDSCVYHQRLNLTYQAKKPVFTIKDQNFICNAYGDSIYNYVDPNNALNNDTIPLVTTVKGVVNYPIVSPNTKGYPIFTQGNFYSFKVQAYEEYIHPVTKAVNIVPLSNNTFHIQNEVSTNAMNTEYQLDSLGIYNYRFMVGNPVLVGDYTKGITATLDYNGSSIPIDWMNGTDKGIRGIILGALPVGGVDFVTKGPDKVLAILRDPPGSNSFASLVKGSSVTNTCSYKAIVNTSTNEKFTANLGGEVTMSLGAFGVETEIKTEDKNDIGGGIEASTTASNGTSRVESYSMSETISTSSSPDYVGANGDVYIANSTNIGFATCNQLSIKPNGQTMDFRITPSYVFIPMGDATSFRYTQSHIVNTLIPSFVKLRESLFSSTKPTGSGVYSKYYSHLNTTDPNFGTKGTYEWFQPTNKNKLAIDSVMFYTNQIANWENIIKRNEMEKLWASGKTPVGNQSSIVYDKQNLSFDAGTVLSRSVTRTSSCETTNETEWNLQGVFSVESGLTINDFGFTLNSEVKAGGGQNNSSGSVTENDITYGYTLSDPDAGNYFSVDVFTPKSQTITPTPDIDNNKTIKSYEVAKVELEGGPIFVTRGGATSCPYEKGDSTLFYKNAANKYEPLSTPTIQIEKPGIEVLVPTVGGIPSGKQASFELVLQNLSEANTASWLQLSVDPASNPHGAIISIDGTPLTEPRLFLVTNEPMHKIARLTQSSTDDLEFKDIRFVIASPCQSDIMATALVTAKFVPSCSDLTLQIDNRTVNTTTGTDLTVMLKDFDKTYKNFGGIILQYKGVNELNWSLAKEFVLNETIMKPTTTDFNRIGTDETSITYTFPMATLYDQTYQFRARTICKGDIYNETPIITVIKDTKRPQSMGLPSPSNGVITPETEVSVTFNENIQADKIAPTDIQVWGVLNGSPQKDNVGLQFDGSQKAFTELPINLQGNSFSIEGKFLANGNTTGTIFSLGEGKDNVTLQQVGNDLKVLAGLSFTKQTTLNADAGFQYFALTYDAGNKNLTLLLWSNANKDKSTLFSEILTDGIAPSGRITVGDGFKGSLRQLSIWNELRSLGTIAEDMSKTKTGKELNLAGYWAMDEGYGNLAVDKARGRNLTVNSSWFISPQGLAAELKGTNQIVAKSGHIPFTTDDDFTVEFWFRGASGQKNATLYSCIGDTVASKNLSVAFNADGNLTLASNGGSYLIPSGGILDNIWHHFAMSVMRGGNANVYIDGLQKYQTAASNIGGMASDSIAFGAKRYYMIGATKPTIDSRFVGSMDEVSIWKSALTSENINLNMHSKLAGNETGLIAYYPFETFNSSGDIVSSLNDASIPEYSTMQNGGIARGESVTFTQNTAAIKVKRSRTKVSSNFTASDNKIVINVLESPATIENCYLEFSMENIMDLNSNRMSGSLNWTGFVSMNRLKWQTESINLTKEVLAPLSFDATISNSSGKYENYVISGLPGWLSVNKTQGTINPLEKTTVTFTVDPSTNVGDYECDIRLTGSKNIDEILPVILKVTGPRPDWSVNPYDFKSSMNVIGKIKIADVYQEDPEDMLAAFIGTRCLGVAKPQFNKTKNSYILYMDIYGDSIQNASALTFSLWDASTGRIYPGVDVIGAPIKYTATSIVGEINNPQIFNATDKVEQQLSIKQGWNWISMNVVPNSTDTQLWDQFKTGIGTNGIQIKSRTGWADYSNNAWGVRSAFTLDETTSMYLLKTNQSQTLKMVGIMADPAVKPVVLNRGWNWIGYVPQFVTPLKDALAGLTAKDGDQIKGQIGFATYSVDTWYGSLQYMMPGLGYMYNYDSKNTNATGTSFRYPSQYFSASKVVKQNNDIAATRWTVEASKYQMSMTVTGVVSIDKNEVSNGDMQVGVFIGDECRGTTTLKYIDTYQRYMAFLMVWGNSEDANKKVTFRSFNPASNQELVVADLSLGFVPDNIIGSLGNPYKINFTISGTDNLNADKFKIYPNPVNDVLHFDCNPEGVEQVEILDNLGRQLTGYSSSARNSINVSNLVPGVYTLRIKYNGNVTNRMFIRK